MWILVTWMPPKLPPGHPFISNVLGGGGPHQIARYGIIFGVHCTVARRLWISWSIGVDSQKLELSIDTSACYFWRQPGLNSVLIPDLSGQVDVALPVSSLSESEYQQIRNS